jgi:hypothetical protein
MAGSGEQRISVTGGPMSDAKRVTIDPAFHFALPAGWVAEPDEEEGVSAYPTEGVGLLHLVAFPHPGEDDLDPAEELYAFLEEQGIEIEEDEVEDLVLEEGSDLSLCEYLAEEEDEDTTYWLVGVATAPGNLVFVSYSCPAGEEEKERAAVRELLSSLRLKAE